jgi:transcription antitermination factor NusG
MPDLLTDATEPALVRNRVGERVRIARGPLQGLTGLIAEIDGDEILVDLRATISGLLVRCPASQLVGT